MGFFVIIMIKSLIILLLTFSFFGYGQELKISAGSVMNIYNKERVWGGYFENISSFYGNINYEHKLRKFGVSYSLSIMSIKQEFTYDFFIPKTTDNIENIYLEFGLSPVFKPLDKLNIKPGINFLSEIKSINIDKNKSGYVTLSLVTEYFILKNWYINSKYSHPFEYQGDESNSGLSPSRNRLPISRIYNLNFGVGYKF